MKLISPENLYGELLKELSTAREEVILISPWVEGNLSFELINSIPVGVNIELLIRAGETEDLKITPPEVLKRVKTKGGKNFLHKSLHAKFVIIDRKTAFVGSANLTDRGLNLCNLGNHEAVVKTSDKKLLKELLKYYETLKGESLEISPNLAGFLIDKTETGNFTALLLEELPEGTFLKAEEKILTLLQRVQKLNTKLQKEELLKRLPSKDFEEYKTEWGKAFLFALSSEGSDITLGELKPLGEVENGTLTTLKIPPRSGAAVFKVEKKELKPLTGRTVYGKPMECPVFAGKAEGIDIYLDLGEIGTRHAAVLGITGSGKSYFTQRVTTRSVKTDCGVSFVVLDPQGEYSEALKELLGEDFEKFVSVRKFENTFLPLTVEDFVSLFELLGFSHLLKVNSKESKLLKDFLAKTIVETAKGNIKPLEQILEEAKKEIPSLEYEIETLKGELVFLYGEEVLKNQPSEFQKAIKKPDKRVVIFDFSQVLDTQTRLNSAGLILRNLFFKREKGERTIAVVEEAHNFAPEKGFGDAEAGKRNLALIMLEKIASQGRKLNFGLWIIAQRPAQVNKYILSQTNTHFLFRLTDKNDLQAVETYLSDTSQGLIKKLPLLGIGECMANGLGVPFEVKLKVE